MPTYEVAMQCSNLPFLCSSGPSFIYLNALKEFSCKSLISKVGLMNCLRLPPIKQTNRTDSFQSGYSRLNPLGIAMLWGMQSNEFEEYRKAGLAAADLIIVSNSRDGTYSSSSASSNSSTCFRGRLISRNLSTTNLVQDNAILKVEVKKMNLSDSSSAVRNLALKILLARRSSIGLGNVQKRYNSSTCLSDS